MFKKVLYLTLLLLTINLNASYNEGKKIFENKCSSCHGEYISIKNLKINFFEKNNEMYKLTVPTVNMLAYAIMDSSKRIGDPEDSEMQQMEIEEYLKGYLEDPDITQTICDDQIVKYYEKKKPIIISDDEAAHLAQFFMEYKKMREKEHPEVIKILKGGYDESKILAQAKKENKKLIIYATSNTCYYCKKMKKEVLDLDDIQKRINDDFIFLEVNVDYVKLPFELKKYFKGITPTFFFMDTNKKLLNSYPGAWVKDDFITILKENNNG